MKMDFGSRKNRILCTVESSQDSWVLSNLCLGVQTVKNSQGKVFSVEDSLLNRVALGAPYKLQKPISSAPSIELSESSKNLLKPYQLHDVNFLLQLNAGMNGNPMGYGKTVEALVWANQLQPRTILIICPKTIKAQWAAQVRKWTDFQDDDIQISPKVLNTKRVRSGEGKLCVITNYEQLVSKTRQEAFKNIMWDVLIVDEVHRIRNAHSKTTLAIKSLPSKNRMGLSGTLILDRPDDLWSSYHFLNPWYLGSSYWQFTMKYCTIEHTFWGDKPIGVTKSPERLQLLKTVLQMITVKNPKGIIGNGCTEEPIVLQMYPQQQRLYSKIKKLAVDELQKDNISVANGMSQLIKLQQVTTNPGVFGEATDGKNIKFDWLQDFMDDNPSTKILVFSIFREAIIALEQLLGEDKCVTIHGLKNEQEREEAKHAFITRPEVQVLAGTIGALGESVDGLQQVCNTVVFFDKKWNPEENNQAIGRVYRFAQKSHVMVYTLVCEGTVDVKVGKANVKKLEDIVAILGE